MGKTNQGKIGFIYINKRNYKTMTKYDILNKKEELKDKK